MAETQMLKGVLDLVVLAALHEGDGYGYDIARRLRDAGLDGVGDASVYGTLRRLFRAGALTSYMATSGEGPARRYYGLNRTGEARFRRSAGAWRDFARTVDRLVAAGPP